MAVEKLEWDQDALDRVQAAPFFVRKLIKKKVEKAAKERGLEKVTVELLDQVKQKQMDSQDS